MSGDFLLLFGTGMFFFGIYELLSISSEYNFLVSALICLFFGAAFRVAGKKSKPTTQSILVATIFLWISSSFFSCLPFFLSSEIDLSLTEAFFESVSGITTTGATVFDNLESVPMNLLAWRAILQWIGGIGIIVILATVFPVLGVGGMQLFSSESVNQHAKFMPKVVQMAYFIVAIYVILTILCFFGLLLGGMSVFDALLHAMTTISTGGFSTSSESITKFSNPIVDSVIIWFMILGSLPFLLYVQVLRSKSFKEIGTSQVILFLTLLGLIVVACILWLFYMKGFSLEEAIRIGSFNVISIFTGTGFKTADYSTWGSFAVCILFFLSFIGGCSGSTSCGIKIFHIQILQKNLKAYAKQILYPDMVIVETYNKREITSEVKNSVTSILVFFLLCFSVLASFLYLSGLDPLTSISASVSSLANLGPGLGEVVGPDSSFALIEDKILLVLSLGMIAGRLEFLPFIVFMSRS